MKVLVTGGTGFIGTHLCRALVDAGHEVTALSRTPGATALPADVETVTGDVTAYDSIEGAFESQDAVVNLVALSPLFKPSGGDDRHAEVHLGGTRNVVDAAETHGVRKLVQLSALGADPDGGTAYVRAKGRAEGVVRGSALAWTILRPSVVFGDGGEFVAFTEALTTPFVTALPGGGRTRFQPIWVSDLVELIAASLDAEHDGETYDLGGPEVLTLAEVATAIYRSRGQSLTVLSLPMSLARVGMSLANPLPFVPFGSDQYRSLRFDNTVADNDVTAFDRDPGELKRFEVYLRERDGRT